MLTLKEISDKVCPENDPLEYFLAKREGNYLCGDVLGYKSYAAIVKKLTDDYLNTLAMRMKVIISCYYIFNPLKVLNDIRAMKDDFVNSYHLFRERVIFFPICSYQWNFQNIIGGKLVFRH